MSEHDGAASLVRSDALLAAVADALPDYIDWAQVWHRQAGGYTASDTALVIMRMERVAKQVAEWKAANIGRTGPAASDGTVPPVVGGTFKGERNDNG